MASRISAVPEDRDWKQAYMAAILEKDRSRVNGRIHTARKKLETRLHELEVGLVPCDEIDAIHDAFYLLQALQSSLSYRDDLSNWRSSGGRNREWPRGRGGG